ncbi:hypothetical protein [Yoonia vestfoldensis]|uniref:hypothetical protein n=1 Tax=Yoonia vestfoldensis TaxID=245188 RepID=UPI00036A5500|nr:hypothetical protein [Yoonia vestfoldensis]
MFILVKALPLSLGTFWRYLILLPFLGIGMVFFSLFSIIPVVGLLVPGMISVWLMIVGLRCALAARGRAQPMSWGTVLTACFFFSIIFLCVGYGVRLMRAGFLWAVTAAGIQIEPFGLFAGLLGASPYWSGFLVAFLAPVAITSAAFAVPLTAAAASSGREGWDYKAFTGFGRGVIGLSIVMAVWMFSGHMFSFFGEVVMASGLVIATILALVNGESLPFQTDLAPWTALRGTLIMTWASSWYFATAVLTWEDHIAKTAASRVRQHDRLVSKPDEIRALRLSRMRKTDK